MLTTKPDHNRIRQIPIPADAPEIDTGMQERRRSLQKFRCIFLLVGEIAWS
jgi:hypothetical protein